LKYSDNEVTGMLMEISGFGLLENDVPDEIIERWRHCVAHIFQN